MQSTSNETPRTLPEVFTDIRSDIKVVVGGLLAVKRSVSNPANDFKNGGVADVGEIIANITLAFRHLEDAQMRLGKAIQAYDGGVSVYDKKSTIGTQPDGAPSNPERFIDSVPVGVDLEMVWPKFIV